VRVRLPCHGRHVRTGTKAVLGAILALAIGWLIVVFGYWAGHKQHSLGPVGDSFAPVGALLTIAALLFAFDQRHADADRVHGDADRAHRDRLADSYARWFEAAWPAINRAIGEMQAATGRVERVQNVLEYFVRECEQSLRLAAVPTLMIERDVPRAGRLKATQAPFTRWTTLPEIDFLLFGASMLDELQKRRTEIESLLEDAGKSLAAS
jgi:hypothetical protein